MQAVIPMAGYGRRFVEAGYTDIKPLIHVDGVPMIEWVLKMVDVCERVVCICSNAHLDTTPLRSAILRVRPDAVVVGIEPHSDGQAWTVSKGQYAIHQFEPTIVCCCDAACRLSFTDLGRLQHAMPPYDAALLAFRGFHPFHCGDKFYAYLQERNYNLTAVQEKRPFTEDRQSEWAWAGVSYVRSGKLLIDYCDRAIASGLRTKGEFYLSEVFNLFVRDNRPVRVLPTSHFVHWGTPEELERYNQAAAEFRERQFWDYQLGQ